MALSPAEIDAINAYSYSVALTEMVRLQAITNKSTDDQQRIRLLAQRLAFMRPAFVARCRKSWRKASARCPFGSRD